MTDPLSSDAFREHLRTAADLPERRPGRQVVHVEGIDEQLRSQVDAAVADLRARLSIAPSGAATETSSAITVEAAGAVTWSDASCGCPEPGRAYAQVPVDGTYVRLAVGRRSYHYHAGAGRAPFLCGT